MKRNLQAILLLATGMLIFSCKKTDFSESQPNQSTSSTPTISPDQSESLRGGGGSSGEGDDTAILIQGNILIDFNTAIPTYTGDSALYPYFSFEKNGTTANTWNAIFTLGSHKLVVKDGATISVSRVSGYAPGIKITGTGAFEVEDGGHIIVSSLNKHTGNILIDVAGEIKIAGEIKNEVTGTLGLPGSITIRSSDGNLWIDRTGLVKDLGVDPGGNNINLVTCGNVAPGDITVDGLVMSYAHAHSGDQTLNRPNIRVASFNGAVTINANTIEPLYDEYQNNGTRYDLYGGLVSWVRDNVVPGSVKVQAKNDVVVNGHGDDPTGTVRKSFGGIAAIATASNAPGGIVDVRSLEGNITGNDRAYDVSGRNRMSINYAFLRLWSKGNIILNITGANNSFNPVVSAASPGVGDKGGKTNLRSFAGSIYVGTSALVSAAVPAGSGSVQGVNQLSSCLGIFNWGTINPADLNTTDDSDNCGDPAPAALFSNCVDLGN